MTKNIKSLGYTFSSDGTFTAFATMIGGEESKVKGSYVCHETDLEMTIPEAGTERLPYSLEGDVLTIRDPKGGGYAKLRKRSEAVP